MLVLASSSPRRREILERFFGEIKVVPSRTIEKLSGKPEDVVLLNARNKAEEVSRRVEPHDIIVAADTVVVLGEKILGKPRSLMDAKRMLLQLSGREHEVFTGYIIMQGSIEIKGIVKTKVKFRNLPDWLVEWYVSTGEPIDKAGAYGIQGLGGVLVESIEGDFYNVMGLPMEVVFLLMQLLKGNR